MLLTCVTLSVAIAILRLKCTEKFRLSSNITILGSSAELPFAESRKSRFRPLTTCSRLLELTGSRGLCGASDLDTGNFALFRSLEKEGRA